jgi:ketosteroid isomerase-like protein
MSAIQSIRTAPVILAAICLPVVMAAELPPKGAPMQQQAAVLEDAAKARLAELDAYWAEVSRAVREGDFKAYVATCHPEGVLVSGTKQMSQPLATALARWEKDFIATREGKVRGNVEFRFSRRLGDATTAHETGIFRYTSLEAGAPPKYEWMRLEALLVKRGDTWKILMENQIGAATQADWDALK